MAKASVNRRRSRVPAYVAVALWLLAGATIAGGTWVALDQPAPPPRTFYVLQWTHTLKCTVATQPPDWGQFRILWRSNDRDAAFGKLGDLEKTFRCY